MLELIIGQIPEAIYFALFMIYAKGVEIDPKMMAIYDYEHEKAMDKATKIKVMQEMYKK